jgi:proteasome lid subunit RPN8/RPN11
MTVDSAIIARILYQARISDREVCGALVGDSQAVREAWPLVNQSPRAEVSFLIPAHEVLRVGKEADASGLVVVGFYHSHPHGSAKPSPSDLEQAVPGYIYLIVAGADVRAWQLCDDRTAFTEVEIST